MESLDTPPPGTSARGRLKIFFGMSPGVGKTYAMLQAAIAKIKEGMDVVAGVVETHGRAETEALLEGIERLPRKRIAYRGVTLEEFDLDAILRRAPQIALVDELAHSNAPGSRHPKRYQDVRELLDHGIHVYTTVNVQHLESRADAVEALCGVKVTERVPDPVLEWANEIEIIDLSPEGLRQRLVEGKVYLGERAATAADAFFVGRNLAALREMALRSTAERVNSDLVRLLKSERDTRPLPTGERVMVAVGPSPFSEKLIRWTKRYAASLNATWVAVHVEPVEPLDAEAQERLNRTLELARDLGAEIVATSGEDVAQTLLQSARREVVTQIVAGRSPHSWPRNVLTGGSLTDRLVARSGSIAVHVVPSEEKHAAIQWKRIGASVAAAPREYLLAFASALILGLLCYPFRVPVGYWTVALLFLTLTVFGGFFLSRGPVLVLAVVSALGWNFFFVPPQFTLRIHLAQDVLLFFLLLLIAVTMGQLTARLRSLNLAERRRERRTFALYRFLDCLNQQADPGQTVEEALAQASNVSGFEVDLVLAGSGLDGRTRFPSNLDLTTKDEGVIAWVVKNQSPAGAHTQNLPDVPSLFFPVPGGDSVAGVIRVRLSGQHLPLATRDLLMQMANLLARFIERENLRSRVEKAQLSEASQRLQKTLLDTVSHELKTPLTIILSAIEQERGRLGRVEEKRDHLADAERSARRLLRSVNMLLDMTRFEGGVVKPKTEMVDVEDLVHHLKAELTEEFGPRADAIRFQTFSDLVCTDEALYSQMLAQLLRNALVHTPPDAEIKCQISRLPDAIKTTVRDRGLGLPDDPEKLFEPFSQGDERRAKGLGLGLSIAKRICQVLGGSLTAMNEPDGGARFTAIFPERKMNLACDKPECRTEASAFRPSSRRAAKKE